MAASPSEYPIKLTIDYPVGPLNRVTTVFRLFTAIPIVIVLALLSGPVEVSEGHEPWKYLAGGIEIVFLPTLLMLLFRHKYPRWWFVWNVAIIKFSLRVSAYLLLLRDEYPSTDEDQAVHVTIPYPDAH